MMKRKNIIVSGYLAYLILCFPIMLWALDDAAVLSHENALVWKIEGRSINTSYIFGTMHSDDSRVLAMMEKFRPQFDETDMVCTEIELSFHAIGKASAVMYFEDGQTLQPIIGKTLFQQSSQALAALGYTAAMVDQLKPWAVIVMLSQPETGTMVLDAVIYNEALVQNKKVCGLEAIAEQINTFDGMDMRDQVNILKETLQLVPQLPAMYQEHIEIYLQQNLSKLVEWSQKYGLKDKRLMDKFIDRLVDKRNTRMVERMLRRMRRYATFFAVGALHLPGEQGILTLLENKGYKISPVH